jgi:hypothetical protein
MKLKELIEKTNLELKNIFNKPVIKKGYDNYDLTEGRRVITISSVERIMRELTDNKYYFSDEKFDIEFAGITLKTKRKKSDITSSWQHTNQMTITEIYLQSNEDQGLLEKTLDEIVNINKEKQSNEQQAEALKKKQNRQAFVNNLNKFGMTIKDFETMQYQYKKLTYSEQRELEENQ